jgi:altronate dehydratase
MNLSYGSDNGSATIACIFKQVGMNLYVFTPGRGTPYGLAEVLVIKVVTRTDLARRWHDLMDLRRLNNLHAQIREAIDVHLDHIATHHRTNVLWRTRVNDVAWKQLKRFGELADLLGNRPDHLV